MKKTIIIFISIIMLLNIPLRVNATSVPIPYNPGISPSILSESEFLTWVFTLFGVRSNSTKDLLNDTNFQDFIEEEWAKGNYDTTFEELKAKWYVDYVRSPYKFTTSRKYFNDMSNTLASVFGLGNSINVNVISEDGEGKFSSEGIIDQLNTMKNTENFIQLTNYADWNNFWTDSTITDNIGSVIVFFEPWQDWATITNIYVSYDTPIIRNGNDYTFTNGGKYFGATSYNDFSRMSLNVGDLINGRTITIDSQYFDVINLEKSQIIQGTVSINPAILDLIKEGAYSLVTPYSMDITSEDVTVAIPNNVGAILEGVTAGTITGEQAIADSRAVPVDITDSQAIAAAQQAVGTSVPEFQTIGLADLFPFCIPFDIVNFLRAFSDDPKAPEFDIKLPNGRTIDGKIQYDIYHVSFAQFNWIAEIVRSMEVVAFCVMLALATRNRMVRS